MTNPTSQISTDTASARGVRPGSPAPALELPVVGGETFRLGERAPKLFTMLVFNRGLHCPVCRAQPRPKTHFFKAGA